MKNKLFLLGALITLSPHAGYAAKVRLCTTLNGFPASCIQGTFCCPNGDYMLEYSCPNGWIHNALTHVCSRASTTGHSDSKGYYTQEYGTCNATEYQRDCCDVQNSDGGIECFMCRMEKV